MANNSDVIKEIKESEGNTGIESKKKAFNDIYDVDTHTLLIQTKKSMEAAKILHKQQKNVKRKREKETSKKLTKCMTKYDDAFEELHETVSSLNQIFEKRPRKIQKTMSAREPKRSKHENFDIEKRSDEKFRSSESHSTDNTAMQRQNDRYRTERSRKEKDDASKRLSKMASTKLRDNNPEITDLSDQNRPTKVAEKMSELYDNQWTDAFDVLEEEMNEKAAVNTLLDTLMNAYKACKELSSRNFFERVQKAIELPKEAWNEKSDYKVVFTDQFKQEIKDFRKIRAPIVIHDLEKVVRPRLNLAKHQSQMVQEYVTFCVEIAWLCAVQDPPLVLDANVTERFNTNVFKDYTSRGDFVEFVVWPAMYLHKGGPILSKGVAQGRSGNQTPTSLYEKPARSVPAKARQREFSNQPCQVVLNDSHFSNQQRDQYHDSSRHHQSHQRTYQSNQQYINKSNTMFAMPRSTSDPLNEQRQRNPSQSTPI